MNQHKGASSPMPLVVAVGLAALAWMLPAHAEICSEHDAAAADAMVDHLDSWPKINLAFTKYGHCDDGDIAEGNSEAVARLLADHWRTLPQLGKLIKRNPPLKAFVLRHIDTTLDTADLDKVKALSRSSCPAGMDAFCLELTNAAARAEQ